MRLQGNSRLHAMDNRKEITDLEVRLIAATGTCESSSCMSLDTIRSKSAVDSSSRWTYAACESAISLLRPVHIKGRAIFLAE